MRAFELALHPDKAAQSLREGWKPEGRDPRPDCGISRGSFHDSPFLPAEGRTRKLDRLNVKAERHGRRFQTSWRCRQDFADAISKF
jgi:hypothetical protein